MPPDSTLAQAMAAHKDGRYSEAEAGYRNVLRQQPGDPKALYYLGLLHFHRGEIAAALNCVQQCLARAPGNAHAWNTLGSMLIADKRSVEAKEAYRKVTAVAPSMGEGWYNLGICLRDEGDFDAAIATLQEAISRQPDYFRAYEALAMLLYQLERTDDAADIYSQWATRDPTNAKAQHMAAATSRRNAPPRAPDEYVQGLFDRSAEGFDANVEQLGYRAPALVAAALAECTKRQLLPAVLDAGCGTGLCGPLIRAQCQSLVGVDLSRKMIERAQARGAYDELIAAELCAFMRSRPQGFDAVISADTLVYFGPLEEPLRAAHTALRADSWLIFTLEALPDGGADHRLEPHGRYGHSEEYVRRALDDAGFQLSTLTHETLRQERLQDVTGYLVTARRR